MTIKAKSSSKKTATRRASPPSKRRATAKKKPSASSRKRATRKSTALAKRPSTSLQVTRDGVVGPVDPDFFKTLRVKLTGNQLTQPYRQHAWVHASVKRRASNVGSTPFRILTEDNDPVQDDMDKAFAEIRTLFPSVPRWLPKVHSRAKPKQFFHELRRHAPGAPLGLLIRAAAVRVIEEGPWYALFRDVNPHMTRSQLWEANVIYMDTDGECFWVLLNNGKPIQPDQIPTEVWVKNKNGWEETVHPKKKVVVGWKHTYTGANRTKQVDTYELHQIVHFRYFDPGNAVRGLAPYNAIELDVKVDYKASIFNDALLDNGALPSGVITTDRPMNRRQVEEVLDEWEARHRGPKKGARPAVLWGGMKWESSHLSQKEMQFFELREWVRDAVMAVYGVPKAELGLIEDVNRATAQVSQKAFWTNTLIPLMHYYEDLLDSNLFSPVSQGRIWGAFDLSAVEALREDLAEKLGAGKALFQMGYPQNDINERLELGMEELEWGGVGWLPKGLIPHGSAPAEDEGEEEDDDPFPFGGDDEGDDDKGDDDKDDDDSGGDASAVAARALVTKLQSPLWEQLLQNQFAPGEKALLGKHRKFLFELASDQLRILDDADMNFIVIPEQLLFDQDKWQRRVIDLFRDTYVWIYRASERQADAEVNELVGERTALRQAGEHEVEEFIMLTNQRISRSVATVRRQLLKTLRQGIELGETKDTLGQRLKAAFKIFRGRSRTVARTEASGVINGARQHVFRRRRVARFEWITARDELVRDTHVIYGAGGKQERGFNWANLSGGTYTLERPHDFRAPAEEVINCRCVLAPALP